MTTVTANSRYSLRAKGYFVDVTDAQGTRTLPCMDESGRVALQRAETINKTGRDPYGYYGKNR